MCMLNSETCVPSQAPRTQENSGSTEAVSSAKVHNFLCQVQRPVKHTPTLVLPAKSLTLTVTSRTPPKTDLCA